MATISMSSPASTLHTYTRRRPHPASPPLAVSSASRLPPASVSISMASRSFRAPRAVAGEAQAAVDVQPRAYTSDSLTIFVKAEGTMVDIAVPKVTKALEAVEGVRGLEVEAEDGIGRILLTMETTIQATGVASKLVEVIQSAGFKLQTLSLAIKDYEDEQKAVIS